MESVADILTEAIKGEIEAYRNLGIAWSGKSLKRSIGIKCYLLFWKRKRLIAEEILKRGETSNEQETA